LRVPKSSSFIGSHFSQESLACCPPKSFFAGMFRRKHALLCIVPTFVSAKQHCFFASLLPAWPLFPYVDRQTVLVSLPSPFPIWRSRPPDGDGLCDFNTIAPFPFLFEKARSSPFSPRFEACLTARCSRKMAENGRPFSLCMAF